MYSKIKSNSLTYTYTVYTHTDGTNQAKAYWVKYLTLQGSPTRTVSTSTISTGTNFIAIGIKLVLVGDPLYCYVVKLVREEIGYVVLTSTNLG